MDRRTWRQRVIRAKPCSRPARVPAAALRLATHRTRPTPEQTRTKPEEADMRLATERGPPDARDQRASARAIAQPSHRKDGVRDTSLAVRGIGHTGPEKVVIDQPPDLALQGGQRPSGKATEPSAETSGSLVKSSWIGPQSASAVCSARLAQHHHNSHYLGTGTGTHLGRSNARESRWKATLTHTHTASFGPTALR
jgi:hypothetical protein